MGLGGGGGGGAGRSIFHPSPPGQLGFPPPSLSLGTVGARPGGWYPRGVAQLPASAPWWLAFSQNHQQERLFLPQWPGPPCFPHPPGSRKTQARERRGTVYFEVTPPGSLPSPGVGRSGGHMREFRSSSSFSRR